VVVLVTVSGVPEPVLSILTRVQVDDLVADTGYSFACYDDVAAQTVVGVAAIDSATQSFAPL
jgi:hypothetical protein